MPSLPLLPGRARARTSVLAACAVVAALFLPVVGCGNQSSGAARAYRIESRSRTIGGPAALADVGDIVLENDVIRAAILAEGNSVGPGMFGGSLVDVDIVRRDGRHPPGRGNDQFSELFPMVNLIIPGYAEDPRASGRFDDLRVEIVDTAAQPGWCEGQGFDRGCAAVRVTGRGDRIVEALGMIAMLGVPMRLSFETHFVLEPGRSYLRIRTDAYADGRFVDGEPAQELESLEAFRAAGLGVFDVLVADGLRPESEQVWMPGYLAGDFLMFGKKVEIFSEGAGYDFPNLFQRAFNAGGDILGSPMGSPALVGVGDGVSYAYASVTPGPVIVPIFTGAFTGAFTHGLRCRRDDEVCRARDRRAMRYERVLAVGRGDVASAVAPIHRLRRASPGFLEGHVYDRSTGAPISGAQVFVVADPYPETHFPQNADDLLEANRRRPEKPGDPGVLTEMRTDLRGDDTPDGSFGGPVPPGTHFAIVRAPGRGLSTPVRVRIELDRTTRVSLAAGLPGKIRFDVYDDTGARSPAKLTFIGPLGNADPCGGPPSASVPDLTEQSGARPLPFGGGEMPGRIASYVFTTDGVGEAHVEPGRYDAWVSRGVEYSVDRQCVSVTAGVPARVVAVVVREVDTTGYVSADFHIHGINSYDAETSHAIRIASALAEGVEMVTPSDHDYLTDFGPTVRAMGVGRRIATAVAVEVTPIEIGHFLGFPLRYDEMAPQRGAIDWTRRDECLGREGDPGWPDCNHGGVPGAVLPLAPGEIRERLLALGSLGPDRTVTIVAHPRDGFFGYFDQFGLDHFEATFQPAGAIRGQHPLLDDPRAFFSWDFDAVELFNAKRFEMIRTPTVREVTGFAADLERVRGDPASTEADVAGVHGAWARRVLERTRLEQNRMRMDSAPGCIDHASCGTGAVCDPQRRMCVAEGVRCTADDGCEAGQVCTSELRPSRCVQACRTDHDCRVDSFCDASDPNRGRCLRRSCAPDEDADAPCVRGGSPASEGVIDDWFRLLNHGVVMAGLGNSDTHSLSSLETGCPRNYIASPTDDPGAIDVGGIAEAMRPVFERDAEGRVRALVRGPRVIATYGPFVELFVEGRPIGSVVPAPEPRDGGEVVVSGEVRVQWPSWFDVDRVEVYRNGELIHSARPFSPSQRLLIVPFTDTLYPEGGVIRDAWYVAIAMAVDPSSRSMSPVYTANRHPNLGFSQVVAVTFASIDDPLLQALVPPPLPLPEQIPVVPYGVTNPVFVDADGEPGFQGPLGPPPGRWEPGRTGTPLLSPVDPIPLAPDTGWDERQRIRRLRTALERGLDCGGNR